MRILFTGWPVLSMTLPLRQPVWASAASGEKTDTTAKMMDRRRFAMLLECILHFVLLF